MTPPDVPEKTEAIEKCPACASEAAIYSGMGEYWVSCKNIRCNWSCPMFSVRTEAISSWNSVARLRERVATMEALVRQAYDAGDGDLFLPAGWLDRANVALRPPEEVK